MLFKEKTNNILIKIFRLLPLSIHVNIYNLSIVQNIKKSKRQLLTHLFDILYKKHSHLVYAMQLYKYTYIYIIYILYILYMMYLF